MKIYRIQIGINPNAQLTNQPHNAPKRPQLKAAFDGLRQLSPQSQPQAHQQNLGSASLKFEPTSDLMLREMQVASATRLDVLELVQDFLKSDQSYKALVKVGMALMEIGFRDRCEKIASTTIREKRHTRSCKFRKSCQFKQKNSARNPFDC